MGSHWRHWGFNNTQKVLDFKLKYIEAFNQMEDQIKQQPQIPDTPRGLVCWR